MPLQIVFFCLAYIPSLGQRPSLFIYFFLPYYLLTMDPQSDNYYWLHSVLFYESHNTLVCMTES